MDGNKQKQLKSKSKIHDALISIFGIFAGYLIVTFKIHVAEPAVNYPFYKGPTIFPLTVLWVMFLSTVPSIYGLIRPAKESSWYIDGKGLPYRPCIFVILLVVFYLYGIFWIGLEISVLAFIGIAVFVLGFRNWKINILLPMVYALILVLIFKKGLGIWFPEPILWSLTGGD
jgi:hypothetical protein